MNNKLVKGGKCLNGSTEVHLTLSRQRDKIIYTVKIYIYIFKICYRNIFSLVKST